MIMTEHSEINIMRRRLVAGAATSMLLASTTLSAAQSNTAADRLKALGLELPPVSQPIANFVQSTRAGNLVFVSGQLPRKDGKMINPGKVGAGVTVEQAKEAAKLCALNVLAVAQAACDGDLSRIRACVRLEGFVACIPSFTDQPAIVNGASDWFRCSARAENTRALPSASTHCRSTPASKSPRFSSRRSCSIVLLGGAR
jgi:enamine deaminase RidA (YjgF/YER057c/UK114 family)